MKYTERNEANILTSDYNKELAEKIFVIKEEFEDDILPAIKKKNDFKIKFETDETEEVLIIKWNWKSRQMERAQEFRRQAQAETEEAYINSIKAYFFNLVIMLLNL